jgi:hypothetical protein
MKVFYCLTCFECYYIHPQVMVTLWVYCSVWVCTGILVRFGWSRVVSECRLEHYVKLSGSLRIYGSFSVRMVRAIMAIVNPTMSFTVK